MMSESRVFRPSLPWTHNPNDDWSVRDSSRVGDRWISYYPEGWSVEYLDAPGAENQPRCGLPYPGDEDKTDFDGGSCGAKPDHEHPHVWCKYRACVVSVSREKVAV